VHPYANEISTKAFFDFNEKERERNCKGERRRRRKSKSIYFLFFNPLSLLIVRPIFLTSSSARSFVLSSDADFSNGISRRGSPFISLALSLELLSFRFSFVAEKPSV
jgi:hypothetical protein